MQEIQTEEPNVVQQLKELEEGVPAGKKKVTRIIKDFVFNKTVAASLDAFLKGEQDPARTFGGLGEGEPQSTGVTLDLSGE